MSELKSIATMKIDVSDHSFLLFAECFNCNPESIPPNSNITKECTIKASSLELQEAALIAQNCITNTPLNVCTDCADRFDVMMAKFKVQDSVSGGDLCFDVKDAVSAHAIG